MGIPIDKVADKGKFLLMPNFENSIKVLKVEVFSLKKSCSQEARLDSANLL